MPVLTTGEAHGGFHVRVADPAELNLPMMDEPHHPRMQRYTHGHTKAWSAIVAGSDAFVFVTPEYSHAQHDADRRRGDHHGGGVPPGDDGEITGTPIMDQSATVMLDSLVRWTAALSTLRPVIEDDAAGRA